jgi:hypothetical protein
MEYKFVDIKSERSIFNFTNKTDFIAEFKVSPFRPEMFGTLIYPTLYYICDKFNIKFVMEGEANLLPFYSLYCDEGIVYDLNLKYNQEKLIKFNKNNEVLIEHIQRDFTKKLNSENINFGTRFSVQPIFSNGRLLNTLLSIVKKIHNISPTEVMSEITYENVKSFIFNLYKRDILLISNSEKNIDFLNIESNKLWFVSHNKPKFKDFEKYVSTCIPEKVIMDTLWFNNQKIYDKILSLDINSFLSTQILSSIKNNTRFVVSGGISSLFQLIPHIKTIHQTIWDYYVMEFDEIKSEMLLKQKTKHILFHVGGVLNNSQKIPFSDVDKNVKFMDVPSYSKTLEKYDDNILYYIDEVGSSLIKQKDVELNKILEVL